MTTASISGTAHGTFTVEVAPVAAPPGVPAAFGLTKVWSGDLVGTGSGTMFAAGGDPADGAAGYVAVELVEGVLDGRRGQLAFLQLGRMTAAGLELRYTVAPGSGTDELTGLDGELHLEAVDGEHRYTLEWTILDA